MGEFLTGPSCPPKDPAFISGIDHDPKQADRLRAMNPHLEPVNLRADGILWKINTEIFHPMGFMLSVDEDGKFYLMGDGSEKHSFATDINVTRARDFDLAIGRARRHNRA